MSTAWLDALDADRKGDFALAALHYKSVLSSSRHSLSALLHLGQLYWHSREMENMPLVTAEFRSVADESWPTRFAEAVELFPRSTEARFWLLFAPWIRHGGDSIDASICKDLLAEDPAVLWPALYVWMAEGSAVAEAAELARYCRYSRTAACRYAWSVLNDPRIPLGSP